MSDQSMPDMGSLLGMAMEMQQQLAAAQQQAAATVVEGAAGGGVVRIEVTGGMEFRRVTIAPEAVDPDDVELLQDLVLAALHDAVANVNALQAQAMGPMGGLGGMDLGAVDLGGMDLGGLLGIGGPDDDDLDDDDDEDEDDDDEDDDEDGPTSSGA